MDKLKHLLFWLGMSVSIGCLLNACVTCKDGCNQLRADYIAFSDNLTYSYELGKCVVPYLRPKSAPYDLKNSNDNATFKRELILLPTGEKTSAYYALDNGLDRVKNVRKKHMGRSPNARYYIITLTDGLDNNSVTLAKVKGNNKNERDLKYEAKIEKKMRKVMGTKKNRFQSYVMYYDARDSYKINADGDTVFYTEAEIKEKLRPYSYGVNATRPEVIYVANGSINELSTKFQEEFSTQSFDFLISKGYKGERIKMVLLNDANEKIEIEGDFEMNRKFFKEHYYLTNIETSAGVTFETNDNGCLEMSVFTESKGQDVLFEIKGLRLNGDLFKVSKKTSAQTQLILVDGNSWSPNVEYRAASSKITNAYLLILLDVSKSFTVLSEAKQQVLTIIKDITED